MGLQLDCWRTGRVTEPVAPRGTPLVQLTWLLTPVRRHRLPPSTLSAPFQWCRGPNGAGIQRPRPVRGARSAKSAKHAEGKPPGDGATTSKEDKRVDASTAGGAFFRVAERRVV